MLLDKAYIGNQEIARLYYGNELVYENGTPPEPGFNWETRLNLSFDGAINDVVAETNTIRPIPSTLIIPNPTPFGTILDISGNELPISIQMTGANTRADVNSVAGSPTPDANLYNQRWWNSGNWFLDLTGLNDTKRYQAQIISYENGVTSGQVITTITYRRGTNAANLFTISGDAINPTPTSYDFLDVNQIRHDELQSQGGQIRLLIQRSGSVARSSICYLVIREYDIEQNGVQTLRTAGTTTSPLPFVEYVPNGSGLKPAFIFLHGSGERGNGNAAALGNAMRYGPNWQAAMGTFHHDAYAFTPQIPTTYQWRENTAVINDFISWVKSNYDVDPDKIYLIGYSSGANGIGQFLTDYTPPLVAGAILIAGYNYPADFDYEKIALAPQWCFANRFDDLQPFADSLAYKEAVEAIEGSEIKFTGFNDYSHLYPQKVVNGTGIGPMVDVAYDPFTESIYDWLLSH